MNRRQSKSFSSSRYLVLRTSHRGFSSIPSSLHPKVFCQQFNLVVVSLLKILYRQCICYPLLLFPQLPFWKCDQKALKLTPKTLKYLSKTVQISFQNILSKNILSPSDHKLFTRTKKTLKNPQKSSQLKAALWLKPDPFFDQFTRDAV